MITKKTVRYVLRAQVALDKALDTNRLKPWEEDHLLVILAKLNKFVDTYGLKDEKKRNH